MKEYFPDFMDRQFNDLFHECLELEAELVQLKSLTDTTYESFLKRDGYKEFEKWIGVMFRTSKNQSVTFANFGVGCDLLYRQIKSSTEEKKLLQIVVKIESAKRQGVGYATRLPFSFGAGWKPGNIELGGLSLSRMFINIPGYLLIAPFLRKEGNGRAYEISLDNLKMVLNKKNKKGEIVNPDELKIAMKDFKILISLTDQVHRNFKTLKSECEKIYNKEFSHYQIDHKIGVRSSSSSAPKYL